MARDWSTAEIEATAASYFEMLRLELAGVPYSKADFNRRLQRMLDDRTKAAIEYKFQNISAVLVNHGQVYIRGYLPAQNYQRALESSVLEWIEGRNDLVEVVEHSPLLNPERPSETPAFSAIVSTPPEPGRAPREVTRVAAARIDFVRRDAENRTLGASGEEFAFELEQRRLHDEEKRPDLARRVKWVARDEGDGCGYDIRSFERNGRPRLIEVKTTALGKYFPFALTRNEVVCSARESTSYRLYRLFDFGPRTGLYVLAGDLNACCTLVPTVYRAMISATDSK